MQFIDVRESVRLAFDTFGDEQAPLVLLISGAGAPGEFWPEEFCRDLAASGRLVVRYSHRDAGLPTHFDERYPIEELLQDMKALIAELGNPTVHLAGHSMGGYIAQMAMCGSPQEFASVTSISAGPTVSLETASKLGMSSASDETWRTLMRNRPEGDLDQDLPGWLESWRFLNGTRPFDEEAARRYTCSLYVGDPRNAQVAVNHVHAMSTVPSSLPAQLKGVRCPFLVIHGTDDPLVLLDNGEASARLVTGSKMVRLQGAGHMFFGGDTWDEIGESLALHTSARA